MLACPACNPLQKAYFNAYFDQEKEELVVVSDAMLPAQPW